MTTLEEIERTRNEAIARYNRVIADVDRLTDMLEDECERLGYGPDERREFFDLMWDYAESAFSSKNRYEVRGWRTVDDDGNVVEP